MYGDQERKSLLHPAFDETRVQAVCRIGGVEELNIGHSIVSRAVLVGMERAVREMKEAILRAECTRPA